MSGLAGARPGGRTRADEVAEVRSLAAGPLQGPPDLDPLVERLGDARIVLLGEASHGTAEYYHWRAELTRRLVAEHGFDFVAVEGDWPDGAAIDRWVKGRDPAHRTAHQVLQGFRRWPTWMWANEEVAAFVDWLRGHNETAGASVGFYGLDVYSLWDSLRQVFAYLGEHHPHEVAAAERAWRCFEPHGEDPQRYAWSTRLVPEGCEREVVDLLLAVRSSPQVGAEDPDARLDAVQNAEVLVGAERYYRTMVRADAESWNVRDLHMADTLDRLLVHHGPGSKAIVWEHNTHVGDARGTDMAEHGMVNVGQVVRQRHEGDGVVLVGFGGRRGSVVAADSWGAPARRLPVPEAREDSHEALLHEALGHPSLLVFGEDRSGPWLSARRGHRAIGVVYHPERDRRGNWVPTVMGRRYDAFLSFDSTRALHPIPAVPVGPEHETEPWGE